MMFPPSAERVWGNRRLKCLTGSAQAPAGGGGIGHTSFAQPPPAPALRQCTCMLPQHRRWAECGACQCQAVGKGFETPELWSGNETPCNGIARVLQQVRALWVTSLGSIGGDGTSASCSGHSSCTNLQKQHVAPHCATPPRSHRTASHRTAPTGCSGPSSLRQQRACSGPGSCSSRYPPTHRHCHGRHAGCNRAGGIS
jgi:hypothetical protein